MFSKLCAQATKWPPAVWKMDCIKAKQEQEEREKFTVIFQGDTLKVEPKAIMMEIRPCHIIRIRF